MVLKYSSLYLGTLCVKQNNFSGHTICLAEIRLICQLKLKKINAKNYGKKAFQMPLSSQNTLQIRVPNYVIL